jgi:hypothetical protein
MRLHRWRCLMYLRSMSFRRIGLILRATPLLGFLSAGVLAVVLGIVAGQQPGVERRLLPTRLAILAIAIAAGFVFDDSATPMSDPLPSPLRWRRLLRASAAFAISAALFSFVLPFAADDMDLVVVVDAPSVGLDSLPPTFPWGRLALEMATMIGFVLAFAAANARRGENEPGRLAVGVFLGVYAVTWLTPTSHNPWASPYDRRWDTGADWWWLAFAIVWLSAAVLSWDSRVGWRPTRSLSASGHPPENGIVRSFVRGLSRKTRFKLRGVEDGPEVKLESERKRGVRGM